MKKSLISVAAALLLFWPQSASADTGGGFVNTVGTSFYRNEKPFHYVGANMWYAPLLARKDGSGDRARLCAELDTLCANGVTSLRFPLILQAEASDTVAAPMALTTAGSEAINDALLAGLDFLMSELARRDMLAVVGLTPSVPWDECAASYPQAEEMPRFKALLGTLLKRTNRYTGVAYTEDATVMAWQIGFRVKAGSEEQARTAAASVVEAAAAVKAIDPYHLVSVGCDGSRSFNLSEAVYQQVHNNWAIDYATLQFWPLEWDWVAVSRTAEDLQYAFVQASQYLETHCRMAAGMDKPLTIDACSYPRDRHSYSPEFSTFCRADFLSFVGGSLTEGMTTGSPLAGFHLWSWAGQGRSDDRKWHATMPVGDFPDEPQGLHAVFDVDRAVLEILQSTAEQLRNE